jgi:hypothetical protein
MTQVRQDRVGYLHSLAEELTAQANRVRNLIGPKHWLSDGYHKEALLLSMLTRHLPAGILAGRGFVVSLQDSRLISTEQDILIVDNTKEAPLFNQHDLLIALPHTVIGSISVKTKMSKSTIREALSGLNTVRQVCREVPNFSIWCGAYFFEISGTGDTYGKHICKNVSKMQSAAPLGLHNRPHHIGADILCCATGLVFRQQHRYYSAPKHLEPAILTGLSCGKMATIAFLTDFMQHISTRFGLSQSSLSVFSDLATYSNCFGPTAIT